MFIHGPYKIDMFIHGAVLVGTNSFFRMEITLTKRRQFILFAEQEDDWRVCDAAKGPSIFQSAFTHTLHLVQARATRSATLVCLWLPLLFLRMEVRHAVNLIEIRLGEKWQPISNQSLVNGSPTTNKADCH